MDTLATLRQLLAQHRPKHPNLGHPLHVRQRVAAYARGRIDLGIERQTVAEELGISPSCLFGWLRSSPALLPVQVVPDDRPGPGTLVLCSPRGFRVEGLQLHELQILLEKLG